MPSVDRSIGTKRKVRDGRHEASANLSSLIVINFDEHGGFYDHVPPPVDVPIPEDGMSFNGVTEKQNVTYAFDRLGIR